MEWKEKLRGEQKESRLLKASAHFTPSPYFPALTWAGVDQRPSKVAVRCGREDASGWSSESSWLKGARFRSITVTLWLCWDLGSLEAGSKPLEPCHVLWAVTDWYSWSAWTHQAEEGRVTKMTVILPLDGDTGRWRAWSTGICCGCRGDGSKSW